MADDIRGGKLTKLTVLGKQEMTEISFFLEGYTNIEFRVRHERHPQHAFDMLYTLLLTAAAQTIPVYPLDDRQQAITPTNATRLPGHSLADSLQIRL